MQKCTNHGIRSQVTIDMSKCVGIQNNPESIYIKLHSGCLCTLFTPSATKPKIKIIWSLWFFKAQCATDKDFVVFIVTYKFGNNSISCVGWNWKNIEKIEVFFAVGKAYIGKFKWTRASRTTGGKGINFFASFSILYNC